MRSNRIFALTLMLSLFSTATLAANNEVLGIAVDAFVLLGKGPSVEKLIGQLGDASVLRESSISSDERLNARARNIVGRLVSSCGRSDLKYSIKVIDNNEVNAYALPGGYLYVNSGLLSLPGASDDEIAFVLGHELAHSNLKHGLSQMKKALLGNLVLGSLVKDAETRFVAELGAQLYMSGRSRKDELEADQQGFAYAVQAGYDTAGGLAFMRRLETLSKGQEDPFAQFFATHPPTHDRAEILKDKMLQLRFGTDFRTSTTSSGVQNTSDYSQNSATFRDMLGLLEGPIYLGDDKSGEKTVYAMEFNLSERELQDRTAARVKLQVKAIPRKDPIVSFNRTEVGRAVAKTDKWETFEFIFSPKVLRPGRNLFDLETFIPDMWDSYDDCEVRQAQLILEPSSGGGKEVLPTEDSLTVSVDDTHQFQEMEGFGASLTDSSAYLLSRLPSEALESVLQDLFDLSVNHIGLSYLRLPMGACDFSVPPSEKCSLLTNEKGEYTYNDTPPLSNFSIKHDEEYIIPLIQKIKHVTKNEIKFMATPWSAPAWMKTKPSLEGGSLKDEYLSTYADYFIKFLEAYKDKGIDIDAVTLQNEPMCANVSYPCMAMKAEQQSALAALLGRKLSDYNRDVVAGAEIRTKIVIWDHNTRNLGDFADTVLANSAAKPFVSGVAFHGYEGLDLSAMQRMSSKCNVYFTESSGSAGDDFAGQLEWVTKNLIIGTVRNGAKTVLRWNLALTKDGKPTIRTDSWKGQGVITMDARGIAELTGDYYALGHASKFVRPGARRIFTTQESSVGFINKDDSIALIVLNENKYDKAVTVLWGDRWFKHVVPARSVTTFKWNSRLPNAVSAWTTMGDKRMLLAPQPHIRFERK